MNFFLIIVLVCLKTIFAINQHFLSIGVNGFFFCYMRRCEDRPYRADSFIVFLNGLNTLRQSPFMSRFHPSMTWTSQHSSQDHQPKLVCSRKARGHVRRSIEWRGRPPRAPLSPSVAMKPVFPFILPLNLYFIRTIITRRPPNAMNIVNIINDRSILDWSSHCVDLQLDEALSSGFLSSSSPLSVVSKAYKTTQSALKSRGGVFSLFVENGEI